MTMRLNSYNSEPIDGERRIVSCSADDPSEPRMQNGRGREFVGVSRDRTATTRITIVMDVDDRDAARIREFVERLMHERA